MFTIIRRRMVPLLGRTLQIPRVFIYRLISDNSLIGKPTLLQPLQCVGKGTITIEGNVKIGCFPSPLCFSTYAYLEARKPSASICIGAGTWINNNFCAIAEYSSIVIGRNCLIGANVEILDSDFHGLKVEERRMSLFEWAIPVRVGDNVFIGSNVKILKGSTIGDGAVIANGAVVVRDVPPGVIAGGNPAKVIKIIE